MLQRDSREDLEVAQGVPAGAAIPTCSWLFISEVLLCEMNSSWRSGAGTFWRPKTLQMNK